MSHLASAGELRPRGRGGGGGTRHFWLRLVDASADDSINYLGTGTTYGGPHTPTVDTFMLAAGPTPTSSASVTMAATDNDVMATLYLMLSNTVTAAITASEVKRNGLALPGDTRPPHTFTGLPRVRTTTVGCLPRTKSAKSRRLLHRRPTRWTRCRTLPRRS